jgi:two-component system, sporulation sensor kinase A
MDPRTLSPQVAPSGADHLKELEDLRYALDQSAIVAITDVKGAIRYVNDKFCEISRYPRAELLGQDHRILNSGHHPKEYIRELWRTIAGGEVWRGELRNRAKDGTIYWVDTTIVPFLNERGKPYQYLAIRYDVTARKMAEEQLINQAALARLGEMVAVVAHEVRNPLAGLRGVLQILSQRLEPQRSEHPIVLEMIKRLDGLNARVNDLLLYAKPRTPRVEAVPLRPLIESTIALLNRDPQMVPLTIQVDGDHVSCAGDAELLQEAFLNLLLNAGQAVDGRGTIRIHVAGGTHARVDITDTGPGIPAEIAPKIFEPFFTTKRAGTGLGLAIVRRLLELQGADVAILSSSSSGTTIRVTLPIVANAVASSPAL